MIYLIYHIILGKENKLAMLIIAFILIFVMYFWYYLLIYINSIIWVTNYMLVIWINFIINVLLVAFIVILFSPKQKKK